MIEKVAFARALRNRNFRALWIGQLVSQIGDSFAIIAVLVVINKLTSSALALGLMVVSITLPQLVFGLIAGVFADRLDRKLTMIVSDVIRGMAILALLTVDSASEIYVFYIVGFLMATVGVFFAPARNAVLPNIVEKDMLLTANALSQSSQVAATVFGPALAGLAIGVLGTSFAFALDSATFFISAAAIAAMSVPTNHNFHEKASPQVLWDQLVEGLVFIKRNRTLLNVILTAVVAMLGLGAVTVLGVKYLDEELGVGATGLGVLNSVQGIGMVVGGILVGNLASHLQSHQIASAGMMILGLAIVSFAMAPTFAIVLVAAFIIGFCMVSARATLATMTQVLAPDEKRGRVEGAMSTLTMVATMVSMGVAGLLGDPLGVQTVFFLAGVLTFISGVTAVFTLQHDGQVRQISSEVQ